jgi:P4 family phage/plasmid primase-like protien
MIIMIEIPKQLQDEKFRFMLINSREKTPFESEWNTKNNYSYNYSKLLEHLSKNGNYGILCGDGLVVVDSDSEKLDDALQKLSATFTVKTSKGKHYYFFCKNCEKSFTIIKNKKHYGEVQSTGRCVVGPNSIHPSGIIYQVINDVPIAEVIFEQLKESLKDFIPKNKFSKVSITTKVGMKTIPNNIKELIENGVEEGQRNFNTWLIVKELCNLRYDPLVIEKIVLDFNAKCKPPRGINEVRNHTNYLLKNPEYLSDKLTKDEIEKLMEQEITKEDEEKISFDIAIPEEFKTMVLQLIIDEEKDRATEVITKFIKNTQHIHTVRDDEYAEVWIYRDGVYIPHGRTYIKEFCREILGDAYTLQFANLVINKIEVDTYIDSKDFFVNTNIEEIGVENGLLNIITKEIKPFTPEKIFFNKLPVKYDPTAICPNIDKHFEAVLKNQKEDKKVMYEWFGFTLLREYKIEKGLMLIGDGRNGKGKTLSLWKRFLGPENCVGITLQQFETDQFALGELLNKLANLAGDIDKRALKTAGSFKNLRGRDAITVARKFLPRVTFVNYAKLVFCANELPITYDSSPAFWNSWVLLEFPYTFVSQKEYDALEDKTNYRVADPNIVDKLTTPEELSGLLNKALEGLERILKQGDFSYSKTVAEVKDLWIRKSDSFQAFVMDKTELDYDGFVEKKVLRKVYNEYCREYKVKALGDKHIKNMLSEMGVGDSRRVVENESMSEQYVWVWEGIKLKTL